MPDDVVDALAEHRDAAEAVAAMHDLHHVADPEVAASTVTMSGRGTITSRTTVSPNSMIDVDELALLGLDHLVLDGHVGQGQQLLLRDERALP